MGILEQLEAGLRAGLGIPEARTGIPRLEVDEEVEVEELEEKENQDDPPEVFVLELDAWVVDEVKQVVCDVCSRIVL